MLKQCGLLAMAACEDASEAHAKKAQNRPLWVSQRKLPGRLQNWQTQLWWQDWQTVSHLLQDAVKSGGDGSLEETLPEALRGLSNPPPPPNPAAPVPPVPPPESARRKGRPQRHGEGHRHTEPAQCADARLKLSPGMYYSQEFARTLF